MVRRLSITSLIVAGITSGVIIDRIAVIVGNSIIKDSDIDRDIRATDFLNGRPLKLGAERKPAADRLIDQALIRREIRIGDYPTATFQEADQELEKLEKQRFANQAAFEKALTSYGLTPLDLRAEFRWQLTVLRFIDQRFKPAVVVTDQQVDDYYKQHKAALGRQHPGESPEDLHDAVRDTLAGEQVNKLFFDWLDQQRREAKIEYHEESLR
jgi:parvulin-like peptidyl-prolyl isomerase